MTLWQMSLSGAVLILAVVFVRALLIHKLPKKTFLALWMLVLLRLLIPFSFSSSFSVYTLAANYMPEELIRRLPEAVLPVFSDTADASQESSRG